MGKFFKVVLPSILFLMIIFFVLSVVSDYFWGTKEFAPAWRVRLYFFLHNVKGADLLSPGPECVEVYVFNVKRTDFDVLGKIKGLTVLHIDDPTFGYAEACDLSPLRNCRQLQFIEAIYLRCENFDELGDVPLCSDVRIWLASPLTNPKIIRKMNNERWQIGLLANVDNISEILSCVNSENYCLQILYDLVDDLSDEERVQLRSKSWKKINGRLPKAFWKNYDARCERY